MTINELKKQHPNCWMTEYFEKCLSGEIIVGNEIKQEIFRTLEKFDIDGIKYDTTEAEKRIKFIENECKHYEAPFAGKPFMLTLRQKAFIECLYSFQIYSDEAQREVRLHKKVLLLTSRKCGKTPFASAIGLAEWFCGEKGTKILLSSNDYSQADLMFQAVNAMREESITVEKVTRKNIKGLFFGNPKNPRKKGKFSFQNKGSITKISAKTGAKEGKNIKVGIVDEVHELANNESVMPIRQALSTQDEPIYIEITTEGFTERGYLDSRLISARNVLKGEEYNPDWMIWLYTQDSEAEIWQDEKTWCKSNPDIGVIKKYSFLRQMLEESKTDKATRAFVLAKDFNIKQSASASWLQEAEIINTATFDIEEFRGAWCIYGNDFMETTDLCASKALFIKPTEPDKVYFYSHYWIPQMKLELSPDDADYESWARGGYMTIVEGSSVETSVVADWQYALYTEYNIKPFKSGYDNRFAKDYVKRFEDVFGKNIAENIPQDFKCLSNPMRKLESDLTQKRANYNNCYGDFWCFKNTGFTLDKLGRIMPCKLEAKKRIDGTAAALCCYAELEWHRSEFMRLIKG